MTIENTRDWLTFAAALGAGITGALNLWWKATEKEDKIHVGMYTLGAENIPQTMLHVVSRCDHAVVVVDYGFIRESGELVSLPEIWEEDPNDEDALVRGSATLSKRNESYEVGTEINWRAIGCYARTSAQRRPRLAFRQDVPIRKRWAIALRSWKLALY